MEFLENILLLLVAAVIVVPLLQRLRISPILGYLITGILIGPFALALVKDPEGVRVLAEFGIVFMMFVIGLGLSVSKLQSMKKQIIGFGGLQVLVTTILMFLGGKIAGFSTELAFVVAIALALSSTAIVLKILGDNGELLSSTGRTSFAVLLFQDLIVAPVLILIPLLAQPDHHLFLSVLSALFKAFVAVSVILVIGRLLLRPFLKIIAMSHNRELFAALSLLLALGTGWATYSVGLSMAFGAFLAGLLLSETEYSHQIEADIEPYRGILLGLFFMTIGMFIDAGLLVHQIGAILSLAIGVLALKFVVIFILCPFFHSTSHQSVRVALLLSQAGEFGFVIFGLAITQGVMPQEIGQLLIVVISLTMAATPWLADFGRHVAREMEKQSLGPQQGDLSAEGSRLSDHIIIAGFGRSGNIIAQVLKHRKIPYVGIDFDPVRVAESRKDGWNCFYGNTVQTELLRKAGIEHAQAVMVTHSRLTIAERVVAVLHYNFPDLHIIAQARDKKHAKSLKEAGASVVVLETVETSLQMGRALLDVIGFSEEERTISVDFVRTEERLSTSEDASDGKDEISL